MEDSPTDAELTKKAFARRQSTGRLYHVKDGIECMEFLRRTGTYWQAPRPNLILLDLNMPRMDGREALKHIKEDAELATIPVVVLTTSHEEADIIAAYSARTNAYIVKPVDLKRFFDVVADIERFWFHTVALPEN